VKPAHSVGELLEKVIARLGALPAKCSRQMGQAVVAQ
jgi:hypothetical protein